MPEHGGAHRAGWASPQYEGEDSLCAERVPFEPVSLFQISETPVYVGIGYVLFVDG